VPPSNILRERAAILLALVLAILGCREERAKDKYEFIELLRVEGTCYENHVRQPATYVGELVHWRNITKQRDRRYGHVKRSGSVVADTLQEIRNPTKYFPPFIIEFSDLTARDITGDALNLSGVSSHDDQGKGYESTCNLRVVTRSNELPPGPKEQ
jgi:hypothetical protein